MLLLLMSSAAAAAAGRPAAAPLAAAPPEHIKFMTAFGYNASAQAGWCSNGWLRVNLLRYPAAVVGVSVGQEWIECSRCFSRTGVERVPAD